MHFGVIWVVELLQHEAVGGVGHDLLRHSHRSVHAYAMQCNVGGGGNGSQYLSSSPTCHHHLLIIITYLSQPK